MGRIRGEDTFDFGELPEELKISDHARDHRGEIGILILTQQIFQILQVVIRPSLDAGAKASEVQSGTAAVPEFERGQGPDQFLLQRTARDLGQVIEVANFRALARCPDFLGDHFLQGETRDGRRSE